MKPDHRDNQTPLKAAAQTIAAACQSKRRIQPRLIYVGGEWGRGHWAWPGAWPIGPEWWGGKQYSDRITTDQINPD